MKTPTSETVKCEHTPTPWIVTHQSITDQDWDVVSEQISGGICVATCGRSEDKNGTVAANAQFIVTACNAHEVLLSACKSVLPYLSELMHQDLIRQLKHAISQATTT